MAFAANGDVEIHFETFGRPGGTPLLLVNGLGAQCIGIPVELCRRLAAEGLSVIRYDNRDVGLSTKLSHIAPDVGGTLRAVVADRPPEVPYRLSDMASDGMAVLDALDVGAANVLGVSMGGMIAQTMAIEHPSRVVTLISVMSTTGDPDVGQPTRDAWRQLTAPPATDRDSYVALQLARARTWGSPACYDEGRLVAQAGEAYDRCYCPDGTARQLMAIMASPPRTAALRRVTAPTLVIHGDADTLVDQTGGRRTAEAVPTSRFELMEGMGHDLPPPYLDRIVGLVASHTGARPT